MKTSQTWSNRTIVFWLAGILVVGVLGYLYFPSLTVMAEIWLTNENYGHGLFIPFISLYLIWELRQKILAATPETSWLGLIWVVTGITLYFIGELATLYIVVWISFWIILMGFVITFIGMKRAKVIWFPLVYLLFMIPLPQFLFRALSQELQLISSSLGIGFLQIVGVTAFQEGNIIDLGPIQLQVAEACSGIRYLLPLMALALLCGYLFKDALWKRICLFLSSIPISILLNGFRIGMIGVLVEWYGTEPAEGFYHLFEGWVLFLASLGILLLEAKLLSRIFNLQAPRSFREIFGFDKRPTPISSLGNSTQAYSATFALSTPFLLSVGLLIPVIFLSSHVEARIEISPERQTLFEFPMKVGEWNGTPFPMDKLDLEVLKVDDYLLADYQAMNLPAINLYVAYYDSQKKGRSVHSPRSCIPGGGWEIQSIERIPIQGRHAQSGGETANLVTIQKGDVRQLVLYWFQQRGRFLSNEYLVKFYLLWDAIFINRTDGALVRLVATMAPGSQAKDVETDLLSFASLLQDEFPRYIPN